MLQVLFIVLLITAPFVFLGWIFWKSVRRENAYRQRQMEEFALGRQVAGWTYDLAQWQQFQQLNRLSSVREGLLYGGVGLVIGIFAWATTEGIPWYLELLAFPALASLLGPFKATIRNNQFGKFQETSAKIHIGLEGLGINGRYKSLDRLRGVRNVRKHGIDCLHFYFSGFRYEEDLWLILPSDQVQNASQIAEQMNIRFRPIAGESLIP